MATTQINYAEQLGSLIKRHLLVFINNRMRVFYTMMVPFIIFVVYILFLRDLELMTVGPVLTEYGLSADDAKLMSYVHTLIDSWMLSGIIAMSTITVSLQINNITVSDKENGINRDFASSPVSSTMLILSYFLSNFVITFAVCFIFLLACFIFLACMGELIITFTSLMAVCGVLIFTTVNSVLFTVFVCSFISRDSTMASIITIFSTAIGFLIGAYMPLFMMPKAVQYLCGFVPGTYCCALFRFAFMSDGIAEMTEYLSGVIPEGASGIMAELTGNFGYNLNFFGIVVTPPYQALVIAVFTLIFIVLNVVFGKKLTAVIGGMTKKIFAKKKNKGSRAE